jgi:hypothetical protein
MRTRASGATPALCAARAGVQPEVNAHQHNKLTKKVSARKLFVIMRPRDIIASSQK